MAFAEICSRLCVGSVSDTTAANSVPVGDWGVRRFPPLYCSDVHIGRWYEELDARRFVIIPTWWTLTVTNVRLERETAYAGWQRGWKYCRRQRTENDHTHDKLVDKPFVRSVEEDPYEEPLAGLIFKHWADRFTSKAADVNLWCGGDHVHKMWFTSNHEYCSRDIDCQIWLW